jgi:hypothetical protein
LPNEAAVDTVAAVEDTLLAVVAADALSVAVGSAVVPLAAPEAGTVAHIAVVMDMADTAAAMDTVMVADGATVGTA